MHLSSRDGEIFLVNIQLDLVLPQGRARTTKDLVNTDKLDVLRKAN